MKKKLLLCLLLLSSIYVWSQDISAKFLLQKADDARAPYSSFKEVVSLYKIEGGKVEESNKLDVFYRLNNDGSGSSLAVFQSPESMAGRKILMADGVTWLQIPGASRAIRISLAQRLSGGVSTGDILSINYRKDYSAEFIEESVVNQKDVTVLELTAVTNRVTYYRIKLYQDKNSYLPLMAEFISKSGIVVKTCYYSSYRQLNGTGICDEIRLIDRLHPNTITVIKNTSIEEASIPDRYFNPNALKDLQF